MTVKIESIDLIFNNLADSTRQLLRSLHHAQGRVTDANGEATRLETCPKTVQPTHNRSAG